MRTKLNMHKIKCAQNEMRPKLNVHKTKCAQH